MSISAVVLVLGLVVGGLLVLAARLRRTPGVLDPERAEHWLIVRAERRPRLQRALRMADRSVVGGSAVAIALVVVWLAAFAVGWIFDTLDTNRGFARWDQSVAEWGSENATALSTDLLTGATSLGATVVLFAALCLVALFDHHRHRDPAVAGFLATVGVGVVLLTNTLKWLVGRDRPPVHHLVDVSGFSFPSGHSSAAAACWAAMALIAMRSARPRLRPVLAGGAACIAFVVAASRALLGVHWLTDVVAGVIVGWAWFFLVAIIFGGRVQRFGDAAEVVAAAPDADRSASDGPMAKGRRA